MGRVEDDETVVAHRTMLLRNLAVKDRREKGPKGEGRLEKGYFNFGKTENTLRLYE